MSGLDDVFERMHDLRQALGKLRETLESSRADMASHWNELEPLWPRSAAALLRERCEHTHELLASIVDIRLDACQRYVDHKLTILDCYLNGL